MPNEVNVTAPITLVAPGRSGTSLVHKLFENHADVDAVGETADLVLGTWYSLALSKNVVRGQRRPIGGYFDYDERALNSCRALLLSLFPSPKRFWMQKPIGTSFLINLNPFRADEAAFATWYWDTYQKLFPHGRFLTIARNPFDVVLSSSEYWGMTQQEAWRIVGMVWRLLLHPKCLVTHLINYEKLVSEPEAEVRQLCVAAGVSFAPTMMNAMQLVHVPRVGTVEEKRDAEKARVERGFSRKSEWKRLEVDAIDWNAITAFKELCLKFGADMHIPDAGELESLRAIA